MSKQSRLCLPDEAQVGNVDLINIEKVESEEEVVMKYDPAWLAILRSTNHLLSVEKKQRYPPGPGSSERCNKKNIAKGTTDPRVEFYLTK